MEKVGNSLRRMSGRGGEDTPKSPKSPQETWRDLDPK